MVVRAVTLGGEHGSGRAEIGRMLAERLGWRLLDKALIDAIARAAKVDPAVARRFDECTDPWLHRIHKALWRGGYEGSATATMSDIFDADMVVDLSRRIILEAADQGDCVIVGRGAQCVLQHRADAFHVFTYAPRRQRIERLRSLEPGCDPETAIDEVDRRREAYIRRYFDQDWNNPHLFNLMLCTSMGEQRAVEVILAALGRQTF